ncbi:hypothetical protein Ae201684P_008914 [Aphanomyces euteiches]|uniref:Uncharacterized protein n=1 Tax=Aphanomyces euteiches TaxID=100861 RepID=A0A6G0XF36_9STRA|nr:hypothetical protein Ae201684_005409 [Aphanomyces euteiches]KAH9093255.1 hypothetical protein Ae201684P_008914 [Aphanomyces euteiches]KAH9157624.1 hypothetical protein AeRB84_000560 [Aphanomyces euteiches]
MDIVIADNEVPDDSTNRDGTAANEALQVDHRLVDILHVDVYTEATVESFRSLIEPFQEQGQLLDPILRSLVLPIVERIQNIIETTRSSSEVTDGSFPFQTLAIDQRIQLHRSSQVLYLLCKVRGYKTIIKLLPHDVAEFEPVLQLLQSQDRDDFITWEIRYVLLLWLSILALVPFDLKTIDSSLNGEEDNAESIVIVANITSICKNYLEDSGPTQQAAALCLARLLSRPDMEQQYLQGFINYVTHEFESFCSSHEATPTEVRIRQYKITGIMQTLSYICKFTPREKHIVLMGNYFHHVINVLETIRALDTDVTVSSTLHRKLGTKLLQRMGLLYLRPKVMTWRYSRGLRSLESNLNIKSVANQIPLQEEEDDDDLEVPEELEQVVDMLLCGLRDRDTIVRWSSAKGIGRITARLPFEFADDIVMSVLELFSTSENDAAWHGASLAVAELSRRCVLLPERLPEAVRVIGLALMYDVRRGAHSIGAHVRDAACYACWSFARAYEPALFLPYLKSTLAPIMLTLCAFDRELNCRRAAAAAFQESVGRQGLANFPHGIDLLTKADYFTLASVSHAYLNVSCHIGKYPEYRYSIMDHLASIKVFHWDANIRVLASKALGLLSPFDVSYSLSSILPQLLIASVSTTAEVIVRHGATLALGEIVLHIASVPAFISGETMRRIKVIPIEMDKNRLYRGRGGEMVRFAVCKLIQTISTVGWPLTPLLVKKYMATLEECIKHPNDSVRNSAISAYEVLAKRYLLKLLESYENQLYIEALVPRFLTQVKEKSVLNPNVAIRRGYLRALGVTPFAILKPHVESTIDLMILAAVSSLHTPDEQDAESRVAAILALVDFSSKLRPQMTSELFLRILEALFKCANEDYAMDERGDVGSWVRKEAMQGIHSIFTCYAQPLETDTPLRTVSVNGFGTGKLLEIRHYKKEMVYVQYEKPAMGYYYFPPNGIGIFCADRVSDSQCSGMFSLPDLSTRLISSPSPGVASEISVPPALISRFCFILVKQLSEKLDSIRSVAGSILYELFSKSDSTEGIPDLPTLSSTLKPTINWNMAHDTFPVVVQLLNSPAYMESVIEGLVISVGGLTESVVKASKGSLLAWLKERHLQNNLKAVSQFAFHCVSLFQKHTKDDRVITPLMKTIAYCLEEGVFDFLHRDGDVFGNAIYEAVRTEITKSSDMHKISAGLSVLLGLLPSQENVEKRTFRGLCVCLGHRFPKVRKLTAEKLYTRLILHDDLMKKHEMDTILSILSETAWDADINQARRSRDNLIDILGFEKVEKRTSGNDKSSTSNASSEKSNSYKSLVREMGY